MYIKRFFLLSPSVLSLFCRTARPLYANARTSSSYRRFIFIRVAGYNQPRKRTLLSFLLSRATLSPPSASARCSFFSVSLSSSSRSIRVYRRFRRRNRGSREYLDRGEPIFSFSITFSRRRFSSFVREFVL